MNWVVNESENLERVRFCLLMRKKLVFLLNIGFGWVTNKSSLIGIPNISMPNFLNLKKLKEHEYMAMEQTSLQYLELPHITT